MQSLDPVGTARSGGLYNEKGVTVARVERARQHIQEARKLLDPLARRLQGPPREAAYDTVTYLREAECDAGALQTLLEEDQC